MSLPAPPSLALALCERRRELVLSSWIAAICELEAFKATPRVEIEANAVLCFEAFLSRMRGEGDEALQAFALRLAQRRFETGFDIHTPIGAAGRFRRGVSAVLRSEGLPMDLEIERVVEDQIDAFNHLFSQAFATLLERASELRLRELFDNASDVFMRFNETGTIVDVNLGFERVLGRERSQWVGRSWLDLVRPADLPETREALATLASGTPVAALPVHLQRGDGESLRLLLSAHRSNGDPGGNIIAILRDVTREETLRAKVVQAEKLASIGQLAASVAHELNNPLTWISSNLTQALDTPALRGLPARDLAIREMLEDSLLGAERMATIVSDLRTYSRIDDHLSEFSLTEVLDLAIRIAGNQLNHRARVERRYGPMPPFVGHAGRLSQVFVNLFVNAAQALERSSSDENRLTITTEHSASGFRIVVADNGPGIPPEILVNVFQPFVSTKGQEGTGLGLWVCKNIVEEHGGLIDVRSSDQGTSFTLTLPHRKAPTLNVERPKPGNSSSAPGLVLIVDDEEILLRVLARRLGAQHQVLTARSGDEAISQLEAVGGEVDSIVCDLAMPGMSGLELYEKIKARWPGTGQRLRFMSGAPEWCGGGKPSELEHRCYRKPVEIPELLEEVHTLVASRRGPPPNRT